MKTKKLLRYLLKPLGKLGFVEYRIPEKGKVLDVGCGNNSPEKIKQLRPDIFYVGLDIGMYNQSEDVEHWADELILTSPEEFHSSIEQYSNTFDAIICSHNLEHCNHPSKVLSAMAKALREGGLLFLTFPCEASVHFPSRKGCLNFYDDSTHKNILSYKETIEELQLHGLDIQEGRQRYRPFIPFFIGLLFEPLGSLLKRSAPLGGTWALYGFETVILAKKHFKT